MSDATKQPQPVGFDGKDTVWLAKSVDAYGDSIDKLTFRPPVAKDARACGMPFRLSADNELIIDLPALMRLAERLANVPQSTIDSLSLVDLTEVQKALMSFFTESPSTSSTVIMMSPGDGTPTLKPYSRSDLLSSSNLSDRRSA
jgi:hypothetical protein